MRIFFPYAQIFVAKKGNNMFFIKKNWSNEHRLLIRFGRLGFFTRRTYDHWCEKNRHMNKVCVHR